LVSVCVQNALESWSICHGRNPGIHKIPHNNRFLGILRLRILAVAQVFQKGRQLVDVRLVDPRIMILLVGMIVGIVVLRVYVADKYIPFGEVVCPFLLSPLFGLTTNYLVVSLFVPGNRHCAWRPGRTGLVVKKYSHELSTDHTGTRSPR